MKKLIIAILCIGMLSVNSCADKYTASKTPVESVSDLKEYTAVKFTDIPETITDSYAGETDVTITGYLSKNISKDGSVGYLWSTGYGTTPSETAVGKCVVLNLSSIDKDEDIVGDQFITVTGSIVSEDYYDVYNIKSAWHLEVDSITTEFELPDNVQEYENYMNSYEWEAVAKVIDFIGTAVYTWQSDEKLIELDLDALECDMNAVMLGTSTDYPQIYAKIKDYLTDFTRYYETISSCLSDKTRPEDIDGLYNSVCKSYEGLSNDLVLFGCFE